MRRRPLPSVLRCLAGAVLLTASGAGVAFAQCLPPLLPPEEQQPCVERYPSWTGELAVLGGNALLGGLSAGVLHKVRGGDFGRAFLKGLAGGAVVYGGKRVAAERFGGAGLVGRELAAVGSSMVRNAGEGRGTLEQVVLPVGPLWVRLQSARPFVRAQVDVVSLGWLLYGLTESELRFDAGMSLSAGTPVFLTHNRIVLADSDTAHAGGTVAPGVLVLADVPLFGREFARRTFEHERIHALQLDQIFMTMTDPVTDAAMLRVPGLRRLEPWIEINLSGYLLSWLIGRVPEHLERPWETEAIFFSR
jgi:hypothetical protein